MLARLLVSLLLVGCAGEAAPPGDDGFDPAELEPNTVAASDNSLAFEAMTVLAWPPEDVLNVEGRPTGLYSMKLVLSDAELACDPRAEGRLAVDVRGSWSTGSISGTYEINATGYDAGTGAAKLSANCCVTSGRFVVEDFDATSGISGFFELELVDQIGMLGTVDVAARFDAGFCQR